MANLLNCSIKQLNEIIRIAVVTNPWSDVSKFPDMKKVTVIRSEGFCNSDGDAATKEGKEEKDDDEGIFMAKKEDMRQHGLRLVTGTLNFTNNSTIESNHKCLHRSFQ